MRDPSNASTLELRLRSTVDALRSSFFFLPAACVVVAIVLAEVMIDVDARIDAGSLPRWVTSTADSGRNLLGAVAAATITVAATVFSVSIVAVQLASSQFSPRVLRSFVRDRVQQSVMGLLVATFTYCLLVLRSIRAPGEGVVDAVVPSLSVLVGLGLAVASVLGILAYIDHTARSIQVVEIIRHVSDETVSVIRATGPLSTGAGTPPPAPLPDPPPDAAPVRSARSGWLQQLSTAAVARSLPAGTTMRFQVRVGEFIAAGQQVGVVWPASAGTVAVDAFHRGTDLGPTRTMQQDISFGIRQLADIALKALSPAINDPTTAYEVTVHIRRLLLELLVRDLPAPVHEHDGRRIELGRELDHAGYVVRSFTQLRPAAAPHPVLVAEILRTIGIVCQELVARGLSGRTAPLHLEADLLLAAACDQARPEDVTLLHDAARAAGLAGGARAENLDATRTTTTTTADADATDAG